MADVIPGQTVNPITLIPVGLKEAALDSPTFRSGFTHFAEQLELVEKWLHGYVRCIGKLAHEVGPFEALVNAFLTQTVPSTYISEAVLDHDYTLLAMRRHGEGAKEFWTATLSGLKKMEANIVEPIKAFLYGEMQSFKDLRRNLEAAQKQLDSLQSRYASQAKSKEPSSLREDAFQLHEARKAYLKISMDFSVMAPQLRMNLDKMLVKVFSDQWRDMRGPQLNISSLIGKWGGDIERVRGWSREMENGEKTFRRELQIARKQIEESAEASIRPSRELEDYSADSVLAPKQRGPSVSTPQLTPGKRSTKAEKQGWLNLRTVTGKPSRAVWLRRWFYVKNGIFGWLVQGSRSGGVEESDRIGVLLCNVRAANSDDRRYVFEVKTKDITIVVQAESQVELNDWLSAFEVAKQKALEDPASTESPGPGPRAQDPAFAISPPSAPEFAASAADSGLLQFTEDGISGIGVDRSSTLPVPGGDLAKNSFDVSTSRRSSALDNNGEPSRDPASRLISKLDIHRKPTGGLAPGSPTSPGLSGSGIASLIAASHGSMPVGPGTLPPTPETSVVRKISAPLSTIHEMPTNTLAPNTLASPPAPTNLSAVAVIVNGERGIGITRPDSSGGAPSGLLANVWGSSNWGFLNRLERGEVKDARHSSPPTPRNRPLDGNKTGDVVPTSLGGNKSPIPPTPVTSSHHKAMSLDGVESPGLPTIRTTSLDYPNHYPLQLRTQDAQFRLLFPNVQHDEKVVLVFKATWNPNEQQEFPGRVYVTPKEIYFYSNHCGMTMTTSLRLDSIGEVTAAKGRDWDVIFLHLKEATKISSFTRITIKTFLEPLRLLQRRLSFLAKTAAEDSIDTEEIMTALIKMEQADPGSSPSVDSWDNASVNTPIGGGSTLNQRISHRDQRDLRADVLIDRGLYGNSSAAEGMKKNKSFKLPKQPVVFVPSGMDQLAVEKEFDITPKALFHVMFGDRSAVWQLLYHERQAQRRVRRARVLDHQIIDSATEHLLYCISDRKTPWHLPHRKDFMLLSKVVVTHVAKSRCKLAIYTKVDWTTDSLPFTSGMIKHAALQDMTLDALDLADVLSDQVRRLVGAHGRTKKAITIFGHIGQQNHVSEFEGSNSPLNARLRRSRKLRTLIGLALQAMGSFAETVATSIIQAIGNCVRWGWNTVTANYLILTALALSIITNLVFSSRNTSEWWRDRKAIQYMSRLGIGSDHTMAKAIYIHDLEDATRLDTHSSTTSENINSMCRDTFNSIMNLYDLPHSVSVPASPKRSQASTALRLQSRRQHLSTRRHDLLVAMRVVNSIEREMVKAEWEHWLMEENVMCEQLGVMLKENVTEDSKSSKGAHKIMSSNGEVDGREMGKVKEWYEEYCGSCKKEGAMVMNL
ncbi:MAG: hypothetical protein Q9217_005497 [Psora testacea]